jgi:NADPH:quinone reductase-like Zn-dependent oxidoreductase
LRRPRNPISGRDLAGTVVELGSAVTRFAVGDEVYGIASGSFAEYAVARQDKLARKPVTLSFVQAAAVPVSAGTALRALVDVGRVRAGQSVLVLGASGGVGSYAVQLAKAFGAHVTGVCSTAKLDLVTALGADSVIDYTVEDFADGEVRYDVIVDVFGRTSLRRLRRALTPHGRLVITGGEGDRWIGGIQRQLGAMLLSPVVGQSLRAFVAKEDAETLEAVNDLVAAGKLKPVLGRSYPLVEAADAVGALQARSSPGRIVLTT